MTEGRLFIIMQEMCIVMLGNLTHQQAVSQACARSFCIILTDKKICQRWVSWLLYQLGGLFS